MVNQHIQCIRWFCATAVLLCHCFISCSQPNSVLNSIGQMSVCLFFAISGYILFDSSLKSSSGAKFVVHRIYRVLPLYAITTIIFCMPPTNIAHNIQYILKAFLFLPQSSENMPFLLDATWSHNNRFFYAMGWTLNYEMFFYIVLAASRVFLAHRLLFINAVFVFLLIIFPATIGNGVFINWDSIRIPDAKLYNITYLNLVTSPINFYFLIGVVARYIEINTNITKIGYMAAAWLYASSFSLLLISIYMSHKNPNLYYSGGSIILTAPFCLVAFLLGDKLKLTHKLLIRLGNISYSIYLVHSLVIIVLYEIGIKTPIMLSVASILATYILSNITHKFIEVGFYNYLKNLTG